MSAYVLKWRLIDKLFSLLPGYPKWLEWGSWEGKCRRRKCETARLRRQRICAKCLPDDSCNNRTHLHGQQIEKERKSCLSKFNLWKYCAQKHYTCQHVTWDLINSLCLSFTCNPLEKKSNLRLRVLQRSRYSNLVLNRGQAGSGRYTVTLMYFGGQLLPGPIPRKETGGPLQSSPSL